jgi:TPP-dependent indolepyruvate ferredoxin oxidoreductase alpha subunit
VKLKNFSTVMRGSVGAMKETSFSSSGTKGGSEVGDSGFHTGFLGRGGKKYVRREKI